MASKTRRTAHNNRKPLGTYEAMKEDINNVYRHLKHNEGILAKLKDIRAPKSIIEIAERCVADRRAELERKVKELDEVCRMVLVAIFHADD